jgi:hypothetical protein
VPAAARFAEDGGAAGCNPVAAIACGVDCADGSAGGAAERATSDESSGAFSDFHQAQRGPDWHPERPTNTAAIVNAWANEVFIAATRLFAPATMAG